MTRDELITSAIATGAPVVVLTGPDTDGLAREWATTHASEFPGGHLALDLLEYRMFQGVSLSVMLLECLRALDAVNPPMTYAHRCAMYRNYVLRRGRMVIALDNVDLSAQVRPFVVPGNVVLVSAWRGRSLYELVTERAHFLDLTALTGTAREHE